MSQLLIQFTHVSKCFGTQTLFDGITLSISQGERFALIGENGSGKTTLLHLINEVLLPDEGQIQRSPLLSIGILPQEVLIPDQEISARQFILEGPLSQLEHKMTVLEEHLNDPDRLKEWAELHEEYERQGGYQCLPVEEVLHGLKIDLELDLPLAQLSSGQRVRLSLAKALIANPDLLLLDEPTNHLDQEMIAWLKEMLCHRKGAAIIVSHNRQFLNEACNRLIEIREGHLTAYGGSYDFYLEEQERLLARKMKAYEEQEEERAALKQKIRALSFAKGKPVPASDRNVMAYDRRGEHHQKSVQRTLDTLKARLEEIEAHPLQHPKPKTITGLTFPIHPLSSNVAIEFHGMSKSFGSKPLFSHFTRVLHKGDRIILAGPNGCGKTTFLKCVIGHLSFDQGTMRWASTAKVAYLDQEIELLPMDQSPLDYFAHHFQLSETDLRRELHKAGLGRVDVLRRPFGQLSVGQRKRLMLLVLILSKPNILLLDEPTNHLDFLTLEVLEKALLRFEGAMIAVSHDQTFINKIATDVWKL